MRRLFSVFSLLAVSLALPVQLATAPPVGATEALICGAGDVIKAKSTFTPNPVGAGNELKNIIKVKNCTEETLNLTYTVKVTEPEACGGKTMGPFGPFPLTLAPGDTQTIKQVLDAPSCAGTYTQTVKFYLAGELILTKKATFTVVTPA